MNQPPISALRLKSISSTNQILPLTRFLAAFIVPVLAAAFLILYLFPQDSEQLFAWGIKPSMNAMMLGSAYLGGAYYFSRVVTAKKWHSIKLGFLPVTTFASFLGITTILHWDKFTHDHPSFVAWAGLYLVLPFVIPVVWWLNRGADPHTPDEVDQRINDDQGRFFYAVGGLLILISLTCMVYPKLIIEIWPWALTPLTGRVMGAMFALPALVAVGVAQDGRWSSARILLQSQMLSIALILLAVLIAQDDLDWSNVGAWLFAGGMAAFWVILMVIYVSVESNLRKNRRD